LTDFGVLVPKKKMKKRERERECKGIFLLDSGSFTY